MRYLMCPIIFYDFLGLFIIMKKAQEYEKSRINEENLDSLLKKYKNHPIFEDYKRDNIGILIDYGGYPKVADHHI